MIDQEYWKIIADRIITLRAKRGFSTYKLESMSGVDTSTIESIEKGQSKNPTIQTLHKIAIGFNMTVSEFLDFPKLNEYSFDDTSKDEDD